MANYDTLEELMNTTDGMTAVRSGTKNDSSTDTISVNIDWFKINGSSISNIYVHGDSKISFNNSSNNNLLVCSRDGASYYVYKQEGTIANKIQFCKVRFSGYTYWSSTSSTYALVYELFLFSNNQMFLNVIQTPTSSSYLGTSSFYSGTTTYSLTIGLNSTCPVRYVMTPTDANCSTWAIQSGIIPDLASTKYLLRSGGLLYTISGELIEGQTTITSEVFEEYGADSAAGVNFDFLKNNEADILWWTDSETPTPPNIVANVSQEEITLRAEFDLSDGNYVGIEKIRLIAIGNLGIRYSANNSTWSKYYSDEDFMDLDWEVVWKKCENTKKLYVEVVLKDETSDVTSIIFYPKINKETS